MEPSPPSRADVCVACRSYGKILGIPSGLRPITSDMFQLDLLLFEPSVRTTFAAHFSSTHSIYRKQIETILAVSIVILERRGVILEGSTAEERAFLTHARRLERVMPR